jgi:hypothetical protein
VLQRFPQFKTPITPLFELANTPFLPDRFRNVCEQFAQFEARSSDDDLWNFVLDGGPRMIVGLVSTLTGQRKPNGWPEYRHLAVSCAILSFCWWETFMKADHENLASWEAEHAEFDQRYKEALAATIERLGPPRLQGADRDEHQHRYAMWRGDTGLLILQQSAYDPQFGLDINYWLQPWSGPDPQPTGLFIDWLCGLSS